MTPDQEAHFLALVERIAVGLERNADLAERMEVRMKEMDAQRKVVEAQAFASVPVARPVGRVRRIGKCPGCGTTGPICDIGCPEAAKR